MHMNMYTGKGVIPRECSSSKSFKYREFGRDAPESEAGFQNSENFDESWIEV